MHKEKKTEGMNGGQRGGTAVIVAKIAFVAVVDGDGRKRRKVSSRRE